MVVGAGFQPALQARSGREIVTTKSEILHGTHDQLSIAMALRIFAMIFAILAFFAVQQRCCDGICVYLLYLRFLRPRAL